MQIFQKNPKTHNFSKQKNSQKFLNEYKNLFEFQKKPKIWEFSPK